MSAAGDRLRATAPVERRFVGGRLSGETRMCRSRRFWSGRDLYELQGDDMVYVLSRENEWPK